MKELLKNTLIGIGISLAICSAFLLAFDLDGTSVYKNYELTRYIVGSIIIGIAWGAPTVLYSKPNVALGLAVAVHLGVGFASLAANGLLIYGSFGPALRFTLVGVVIGLVIGFGFHLSNRKQASLLNDQLSKQND